MSGIHTLRSKSTTFLLVVWATLWPNEENSCWLSLLDTIRVKILILLRWQNSVLKVSNPPMCIAHNHEKKVTEIIIRFTRIYSPVEKFALCLHYIWILFAVLTQIGIILGLPLDSFGFLEKRLLFEESTWWLALFIFLFILFGILYGELHYLWISFHSFWNPIPQCLALF